MTSPIQRRNRIDSLRHVGTIFVCVGGVLIAAWVALTIWRGFHVSTAIELALGIFLLVQGMVRLGAAAKALTVLEKEHGPNAGYQEPVQRS